MSYGARAEFWPLLEVTVPSGTIASGFDKIFRSTWTGSAFV